jgi:pyruvate kinase
MAAPLEIPPPTLTKRLIELRVEIEHETGRILDQYCADEACLTNDKSVRNLAHYIALRRHDLRQIQEELAEAGISSLGRCEAHVMHTLNRVVTILQQGYSHTTTTAAELRYGPNFYEGNTLLGENTMRLFGPPSHNRHTRIMVTLPTEAAHDPQLVHDLLTSGMNCARINCAHDDQQTWRKMVTNIIQARSLTGRECTILMDLAGQKIRTQLESRRPDQVQLKPHHEKQAEGNAELLFYRLGDQGTQKISAHEGTATIGLPTSIFDKLQPGDRFEFINPNGKIRHIHLTDQSSDGDWIGNCKKKAVLELHTPIDWQRRNDAGAYITIGGFLAGDFAPQANEIRLFLDDRLLLARQEGGHFIDDDINTIGCSHTRVIDSLSPNQRVWFDDGKLGTMVDRVDEHGAWLHVTHSRPNGVKLRHDKGINFPDTHLHLPCLTEKDLDDLDFICRHADMVGFSFVQSGEDMQALMAELKQRNASHLGIIAKIETRVAVKNLPAIMFSTLTTHRLGIMIARGDLAVELGGVRLAEIQEELLWLCEAAHVPVIWATQVLETLAKKGISSRPELTDAAMAGRAECVMLNKGPYIQEAVSTLNSILVRMQEHQQKKSSQLRALHW